VSIGRRASISCSRILRYSRASCVIFMFESHSITLQFQSWLKLKYQNNNIDLEMKRQHPAAARPARRARAARRVS